MGPTTKNGRAKYQKTERERVKRIFRDAIKAGARKPGEVVDWLLTEGVKTPSGQDPNKAFVSNFMQCHGIRYRTVRATKATNGTTTKKATNGTTGFIRAAMASNVIDDSVKLALIKEFFEVNA